MKTIKGQKILISGESIAGLSTAWWLDHIGYQVTVVEMAGAPRTNGGAVNLIAQAVKLLNEWAFMRSLKSINSALTASIWPLPHLE